MFKQVETILLVQNSIQGNFTSMSKLKYILISTFFIWNTTLILAQNSISSTTFLSGATVQKTVQAATNKLAVQINQDSELPWLQELEIRTETNDFLWKQQEYVLRVQPNTKRQRNAQRNHHQALMDLSKTEQELVLKKALFTRYEWIIEWLKIEQSIKDKLELQLIYDDKLTIAKQSINNLNFDVTDFVKAEEDVLENQLKIKALEIKKNQLLNTFQYLTNGKNSFVFDKNTMISINQIRNKMTVQSLDSLNSLALERRKNKIDILDKEAEIERSEIYNPINYAQVKAGGNGENFREFVSFGVGIKLPLKGDKKMDLNELDLEKFEASNEYIILKEKLVYEQQQLVTEMNQILVQKQFLQKQLDNSQTVFILERLLKTDDSNPVDILDLKEIIIKKEQKIKQFDFQMFTIYLEWLAVSNKMMERPLQNHLLSEQGLF